MDLSWHIGDDTSNKDFDEWKQMLDQDDQQQNTREVPKFGILLLQVLADGACVLILWCDAIFPRILTSVVHDRTVERNADCS